MLGDKKAVPLWSQRRPNLVEQQRALTPEGGTPEERRTDSEKAVIKKKIVDHRFEVSKGRVHPAT